MHQSKEDNFNCVFPKRSFEYNPVREDLNFV